MKQRKLSVDTSAVSSSKREQQPASPELFKNRASLLDFDHLLPPIPLQVPENVEKMVSKYAPDALKNYLEQMQEQELKDQKIIRKELPPYQTQDVSFEGFMNLAVIFLVSACLLLLIDNFASKGLLVDMSLLKCIIEGDVYLSLRIVAVRDFFFYKLGYFTCLLHRFWNL